MLDVIVTRSPHTPGRWVKQAFDSVAEAIKATAFPVNVIEIPWVEGHIGEAMMNGIAAAKSDYLCWVDDDDFVLPQIFRSFGDILVQKPQAVFARQVDLMPNGWLALRQDRSHLEVLNRTWALTLDLTPFRASPTQAIGAKAKGGIDLWEWNYIHRAGHGRSLAVRNGNFHKEAALWRT